MTHGPRENRWQSALCGAAIAGNPDLMLAKLDAYRHMGIEAFTLSGYSHAAEADLFARHVLPDIDHSRLR